MRSLLELLFLLKTCCMWDHAQHCVHVQVYALKPELDKLNVRLCAVVHEAIPAEIQAFKPAFWRAPRTEHQCAKLHGCQVCLATAFAGLVTSTATRPRPSTAV